MMSLTQLLYAIQNDQAEIVKLWLDAPGVDVNTADSKGRTALHLAVRCGRPKIVAQLLHDPGVRVNTVDDDGMTPLLWALREVQDCQAEIVKLLLDAHDVDVVAALGLAVEHCPSGIVKLLLDSPGVKVGGALGLAIKRGEAGIFEQLLHDPRVDVGMTPLRQAVQCDRARFVTQLLRHPRFNVHAADGKGMMPLRLAEEGGNPEIINLPREAAGVDLKAANSDQLAEKCGNAAKARCRWRIYTRRGR